MFDDLVFDGFANVELVVDDFVCHSVAYEEFAGDEVAGDGAVARAGRSMTKMGVFEGAGANGAIAKGVGAQRCWYMNQAPYEGSGVAVGRSLTVLALG